mmetsp:Transcript_84716/g.252464  ORF Transcript_84716/g.252464 Transcript_84716/m.252464 type:complete len:226 (-) Transcript_84716:203-880(-)
MAGAFQRHGQRGARRRAAALAAGAQRRCRAKWLAGHAGGGRWRSHAGGGRAGHPLEHEPAGPEPHARGADGVPAGGEGDVDVRGGLRGEVSGGAGDFKDRRREQDPDPWHAGLGQAYRFLALRRDPRDARPPGHRTDDDLRRAPARRLEVREDRQGHVRLHADLRALARRGWPPGALAEGRGLLQRAQLCGEEPRGQDRGDRDKAQGLWRGRQRGQLPGHCGPPR